MKVEVTCCKDCKHRMERNGAILGPPGYWGDSEEEVDWTCPLIDRDDLWNSWYMPDDFFCPKGEPKKIPENKKDPLT